MSLRENGRDGRLPPKAFDLLLAPVKQGGHKVGREELSRSMSGEVLTGSSPREGRQCGLLREADAPEEVCKSWVRAKAVEPWLYPQVNDRTIALLISLFQPLKRLVVLAKSGVDECYVIR